MPIEALEDPAIFELATQEVFGPVQVIVEYGDDAHNDIDVVLRMFCQLLLQHLRKGYLWHCPLILDTICLQVTATIWKIISLLVSSPTTLNSFSMFWWVPALCAHWKHCCSCWVVVHVCNAFRRSVQLTARPMLVGERVQPELRNRCGLDLVAIHCLRAFTRKR